MNAGENMSSLSRGGSLTRESGRLGKKTVHAKGVLDSTCIVLF